MADWMQRSPQWVQATPRWTQVSDAGGGGGGDDDETGDELLIYSPTEAPSRSPVRHPYGFAR